jgi:hypothetical protein
VCCPVVGCLIVFLSSLDYGFAFVIIVNTTRFYFVIIINTVTMTAYVFCVKKHSCNVGFARSTCCVSAAIVCVVARHHFAWLGNLLRVGKINKRLAMCSARHRGSAWPRLSRASLPRAGLATRKPRPTCRPVIAGGRRF